MRSLLSFLRPVVLAVGLLAVGLPNAAFAAPATPAQSGLTFVAAYAGTAAFTSASTAHFNGKGFASLLGASTNSGDIVITGSDPSCTGGLANTNTETLTANGDILVLTLHDVSCPISSGVYQGSGHWEVTSGTGRYRGASGQGTAYGGADFNHGNFAFSLIGTIVLASTSAN